MIKDIEKLKEETAKNSEYINIAILEVNKTTKVLVAAFVILAIIDLIILYNIL